MATGLEKVSFHSNMCPTLATLWMIACQFPLSKGVSRQEYTDLNKQDLYDPDNHDGVITHVEPDILECEVKWALGSIITNKASGGDRSPFELFQILMMML